MLDNSRPPSELNPLLADFDLQKPGMPPGPGRPANLQKPDDLPDEEVGPKLKEVKLHELKVSREPEPDIVLNDSLESLNLTVCKLAERLNEVQAMVQKLDRAKSWAANRQDEICTAVQFRQLVERVKQMNQRISEISTKLQGTVGYDTYHQFKCEKCGGEGLVATPYRCTRCGTQTWRGWWPNK